MKVKTNTTNNDKMILLVKKLLEIEKDLFYAAWKYKLLNQVGEASMLIHEGTFFLIWHSIISILSKKHVSYHISSIRFYRKLIRVITIKTG